MSIAAPVAQIEVAPAYRPSWHREDAGSHVPLPPASVAVPREVLPGDVIVWGTVEDQRLPLVSVDGGQGYLRYDWDAWQRYVLTERYHTQQRPLYTRLPFHYHRVPGTLRRLVARAMLSGQAPTDGAPSQFPGFPIEQGLELINHVRGELAPAAAPPCPPPDKSC